MRQGYTPGNHGPAARLKKDILVQRERSNWYPEGETDGCSYELIA